MLWFAILYCVLHFTGGNFQRWHEILALIVKMFHRCILTSKHIYRASHMHQMFTRFYLKNHSKTYRWLEQHHYVKCLLEFFLPVVSRKYEFIKIANCCTHNISSSDLYPKHAKINEIWPFAILGFRSQHINEK